MACSHLSQMAFGVPLGKAKPYIKEVAKGYPMSRSLVRRQCTGLPKFPNWPVQASLPCGRLITGSPHAKLTRVNMPAHQVSRGWPPLLYMTSLNLMPS